MADDMLDRMTKVITAELPTDLDSAKRTAVALLRAMQDPTEAMCSAVSMNINADAVWRSMLKACMEVYSISFYSPPPVARRKRFAA